MRAENSHFNVNGNIDNIEFSTIVAEPLDSSAEELVGLIHSFDVSCEISETVEDNVTKQQEPQIKITGLIGRTMSCIIHRQTFSKHLVFKKQRHLHCVLDAPHLLLDVMIF